MRALVLVIALLVNRTPLIYGYSVSVMSSNGVLPGPKLKYYQYHSSTALSKVQLSSLVNKYIYSSSTGIGLSSGERKMDVEEAAGLLSK